MTPNKKLLIEMAIESGFILSDDTGIKIRGETGHLFDITDQMADFAVRVLKSHVHKTADLFSEIQP